MAQLCMMVAGVESDMPAWEIINKDWGLLQPPTMCLHYTLYASFSSW